MAAPDVAPMYLVTFSFTILQQDCMFYFNLDFGVISSRQVRGIHARRSTYSGLMCCGGYERACMALVIEPHRVYSRHFLLEVGHCVLDPSDYLRPALLS